MECGIHIEKQFIPYPKLVKATITPGHPFEEALTFLQEYLKGNQKFRFYTSGSTGPPKEVWLTREQLQHSAQTTAEVLNLRQDFKCLVCISTNHIGGKMMLVRGVEIGMDLFLVPPKSIPEIPEGVSFDFVALIPLQLQHLVSSDIGLGFLNSCQVVIVGGGQVSSTLEEMLSAVDTPIYQTYGMTETASHIALKKLNQPGKQNSYRILDGIVIEQDLNGCLIIRGEVTNNQPLTTNDVVEIESPNSFKWVGRFDGAINTGGHKVLPETIEPVIRRCLQAYGVQAPFITIGIADNTWGERVTLVIESAKLNSKQLQQVRACLSSKLKNYQVPKSIETVNRFPITPTGKVDNEQIKRQLASNL